VERHMPGSSHQGAPPAESVLLTSPHSMPEFALPRWAMLGAYGGRPFDPQLGEWLVAICLSSFVLSCVCGCCLIGGLRSGRKPRPEEPVVDEEDDTVLPTSLNEPRGSYMAITHTLTTDAVVAFSTDGRCVKSGRLTDKVHEHFETTQSGSDDEEEEEARAGLVAVVEGTSGDELGEQADDSGARR